MKINSSSINNSPSYKGFWNNKAVLKGLETISEHGTTFVAATTLAMSAGVRPIAINLTPDVKKENKQYATTNSIASGLIKFGIVEAIAIPIENAVKKIDKNPEKYLTPQTIKTLQGNAKTLAESRSYKFATQILKMGTGLITAIPKAMLTVALIPVIMNKLFPKKEAKKPNLNELIFSNDDNIFSSDFNNKELKTPSFKGGITEQTAKGIGKILNNNSVQNFVKKYSSQDTNIARNMSIATDVLLTASFVHRTVKSEKIEKERKKALICNNVISTGITLAGGYSIDKLIQKNTNNFIENFKKVNGKNPKLSKYVEGINILRPTIIFALLYYGVLPVFSTYLSDKIDKLTQKTSSNQLKETHKI